MILCCGEALIDMVPGTSVDGDACFAPKAGGAVFNTAIALGRLGAGVGLFTGVSDDLFGRILQDELAASMVKTHHLVTCDAPSSLAFVELNEGQARYTFYTDNAADTSLTSAEVPSDLNDVKAMFFGGISLCTDPTASTLNDLMRAKADDCLMMIDPNIRAAFISDETSYRARLHDMIGLSDILKISDEDLAWLAPNATDISDQLNTLLGDSNTLVFVTKGSEGAVAYRGGQQIAQASSVKVTVADTIGAGDTFNAGVLHVLQQHDALNKSFAANPDLPVVQAALELAVRAAGVTVSRKGANPPWAHEIS